VNHGIDEAVRGVQRLKKAPHAFREVYYKSVAGLERRRALINGQFMHEMAGEEEDNVAFFEEEFNRAREAVKKGEPLPKTKEIKWSSELEASLGRLQSLLFERA